MAAQGSGSGLAPPPKAGEKVAHGFSSPGNAGTSMEVRDEADSKWNDEATQMHHFSEKMRFDKSHYSNAQKATGAAAMPGDTGSDQALTAASGDTAEGQTHGILHHSPDTLKQAREPGPGEWVDTRDVAAAEEAESLPPEEVAARGLGVLPGSQGAAAPGWKRGIHTLGWVAQGERTPEGERSAAGIDPSLHYSPSEAPADFDQDVTPKPEPPDERAPIIEDDSGAMPASRVDTVLQWEGISGVATGGVPTQKGYHTLSAARGPLPGVSTPRRGMRTRVVARAAMGEPGMQDEDTRRDAQRMSASGAAGQEATAAASPGERSTADIKEREPVAADVKEPEPATGRLSDTEGGGDADEVMERRVSDPDVGGYAS